MKICINGAKGKMGQTLVEFVKNNSATTLAGEVDMGDSLADIIKSNAPDVVVDFTRPEIRMETVKTILFGGSAAVVGTTGFTPEDLAQIELWVKETGKGCFIAPNFIIGNVLMQQFAKKAAEYYPNAEIIEYHHEQKVDFPSGTAYKTAELMCEVRDSFNDNTNDKVANVEGARGGDYKGIKLHAIRMPGFVASQEVILGDSGQYLTIRHDSIDRQSYMPGVLMAAQHITDNAELIYGLEHIL
ncbi:MAG: 4-hydroxy-tetrahydrodipicolinate reductase [Lentisphaeraceae bacterium]|nr:4-hydroxy-tetrahydrodipicolinate reductase [Lentisphaeraceae bacterium]